MTHLALVTDIGRRFRATRVLELDIELTADDVRNRDRGEEASETAMAIAEGTFDSWAVVHTSVEEL